MDERLKKNGKNCEESEKFFAIRALTQFLGFS